MGSFSTIGLDSHLGFRQKGLREAKETSLFHFQEKEEERAEEERRARFSRQPAREDFGGHDYRGAINASTDFEEEVQQHLIGCTDLEVKGTACIYCWHEFREEVRPHLLQIVQYGFGTVFEVNLQHRFRGKVQHVSQGSNIKFLARISRSYGCI